MTSGNDRTIVRVAELSVYNVLILFMNRRRQRCLRSPERHSTPRNSAVVADRSPARVQGQTQHY